MCKNLNRIQIIYLFIIIFLIISGITTYFIYKKDVNWIKLKSTFVVRNKPNWFFKKLHIDDNLNKVASIIIESKEQKLTIVKQDQDWFILEKDNYLALPVRIKELLFGLADLKIVDAKTTNPEHFAAIDLKDLESGNSITKISLFTQDHNQIDSIYLGKREFIASPNSNYQNYIFVRRTTENQSWLVAGNLPEKFTFKDLVSQPLINLDLNQISGLKLFKVKSPKNIIYIKLNVANKELKLTDIPKGYKLKDQYLLDSLIQQFTYLNYDDVLKDPGDTVPILVGELFLSASDEKLKEQDKDKPNSINFELVYLNKNYYFRFNSKLDQASNNKWLYKISDYACQSLLINKNDLIDKI